MADNKRREESLKQDLKLWEKQFAAANNGRQASRRDIKQHPDIASKYKEYQVLRDASSSRANPAEISKLPPKRKADEASCLHGLQNCRRAFPPKEQQECLSINPDSDKENGTPVAKRIWIDPTPQKDGRVLGLFDLIPVLTTPSKSEARIARIVSTPNHRHPSHQLCSPTALVAERTPTTALKHLRTPQSSTKRFLLDTFATPSKRQKLAVPPTPCMIAAASNTPAFLNRYSSAFAPIAEDERSAVSPVVTRAFQPRGAQRIGLTRSLSTMIADMRQAEDDRLDQEMDILREMEGQGSEQDFNPQEKTRELQSTKLQQRDNMALGPDGSIPFNEGGPHAWNELGKGNNPMKVWRKKGQKRQTKRVILRPTTKSKPEPPALQISRSVITSFDGSGSKASTPPPARQRRCPATCMDDDGDLNDSDFDGIDVDVNNNSHGSLDKAFISAKIGGAQATVSESFVKKVAKRVSATANANFCRLKIRSSKGAKAGKGMFGKRR